LNDKKDRRWSATHITLGLAIAWVALTTGVAVTWRLVGPGHDFCGDQEHATACGWDAEITRLGIEPLFPLQEDVYVGDVFAAVTQSNSPFLRRAVKLAHVDLSVALEAAYDTVPAFEEPQAARGEGGAAQAGRGESKLFRPRGRKAPLAAFPGVSIIVRRGNPAEVSDEWREIEEISITRAETYGVPSVIATGYLRDFCADPLTLPICEETHMREQLSMVVGNSVLRKFDDRDTGSQHYDLGVELVLVSQVYLARSIVTSRSRAPVAASRVGTSPSIPETAAITPGIGSVSGIRASPKLKPKKAKEARSREAIATTNERETASSAAADEHSRDEQRSQMPPASGSEMPLAAKGAERVILRTEFPRPVAFGFRAVRFLPSTLDTESPAPDTPRRDPAGYCKDAASALGQECRQLRGSTSGFHSDSGMHIYRYR